MFLQDVQHLIIAICKRKGPVKAACMPSDRKDKNITVVARMFGTSVNPMQMRLYRHRHAPHLQDIRCTHTNSTHTHAPCETELLGKLHWQAPHMVSFIGRQDTSVVAATTDNHHQHTTYKNLESIPAHTRLLLLLWVAAMNQQKRRDARFPTSLCRRVMLHD